MNHMQQLPALGAHWGRTGGAAWRGEVEGQGWSPRSRAALRSAATSSSPRPSGDSGQTGPTEAVSSPGAHGTLTAFCSTVAICEAPLRWENYVILLPILEVLRQPQMGFAAPGRGLNLHPFCICNSKSVHILSF